MLDTQWEALVGRIKDTFPVEDELREELTDGPGHRHAVIFQGPAGKMLVERIVKPLMLGTHAISANRIGAASTVVHEYSETETTSTVRLFRWQNEEWQEMDLRGLGAHGGGTE